MNGYTLLPGGEFASVKLTQGFDTLVDVGDLARILRHTWCAAYVHGMLYVIAKIDNRTVYLHRFLLPHIRRIDHKNGDGLDNRKQNLRAATQSQNMGNMRKTRFPTTSRYKGVHRLPNGNWRARLQAGPNRTNVSKCFPTEEEAALWYNERAKEFFGEYALLNVVELQS